jgi:hypothetical protein
LVEDAVRLSGKTEDEVAAELEAVEERFAQVGAEFEAPVPTAAPCERSWSNAAPERQLHA